MNVIKTHDINVWKAAILYRPEMLGGFDIAERHLLDFIAMTPSLQKNTTSKLSSVTRSVGGRGGGHRSECGFDITTESGDQPAMSAIKNKYFCLSERVYVPREEYKNMSKARQ